MAPAAIARSDATKQSSGPDVVLGCFAPLEMTECDGRLASLNGVDGCRLNWKLSARESAALFPAR